MRLGFAYLDGSGPNWFDFTGDPPEGKKNLEGLNVGSRGSCYPTLILQLELRISEGAGAFRPLKTGQKETAFRPGPLSSGQIQL